MNFGKTFWKSLERPLEDFWKTLERPLERLWEDFGKTFGKTLGRPLERLWEDFGKHVADARGGGGSGFLEVSGENFW